MKTGRRWIISAVVVLGVLAVGAGAFVVGAKAMSDAGYSLSAGRCVVAKNGERLIVSDMGPIVMTNVSADDEMISELNTGDRILVIHDMVNTTYPGTTGVHYCLKLGGGDIEDVPKEHLKQLAELGWVDYEQAD